MCGGGRRAEPCEARERALVPKSRCFSPAEAKAVRGEEGRQEPRRLAEQGERACQGFSENLNFLTRADTGELS